MANRIGGPVVTIQSRQRRRGIGRETRRGLRGPLRLCITKGTPYTADELVDVTSHLKFVLTAWENQQVGAAADMGQCIYYFLICKFMYRVLSTVRSMHIHICCEEVDLILSLEKPLKEG